MDKKKKNSLNVLLIFILIGITCVYFYFNFDLREIAEGIAKANFPVLCIGFFAALIYFYCYGWFARVTLKPFGTKIPVLHGLLYAATDFYYSALTPSATGGQPLVIYHMTRDGIPTSQASFFAFFHTAVYKIVLILFNIIAFFFCFAEFRACSVTFTVLWFVGMGINLLMISLCFISMFNRPLTQKIGGRVLKICGKIHIIKNPEERINGFITAHEDYHTLASEVLHDRGLLLKQLGIVIIQRASFFSIAYIVYRGMGLSAHHYLYFLCLQALIAMSVDSLPLPGGIGVNEAALVLTLESAYGTPEAAAAATLIIRVINYYFCFVVASIGVLTQQFLQKRRAVQ